MSVYSVTEFFNELDLLELRLETMSPYVDYFVVSESTMTHSGKPKPLYYWKNRERYRKFHDKIIHQIVDNSPASLEELKNMKPRGDFHARVITNVLRSDWFDHNINSYLRDTYEKECLLVPLRFCEKDDIILFGDLDEIVRPEALEKVLKKFHDMTVYNFRNDMFYYYLNNQKVNEPWVGTLAISFRKFYYDDVYSFCGLRTYREGAFIDNGGWHFTYMGGADKIKQKIESWGEQSLNQEFIKQSIDYNIINFRTTGKDLFFRPAEFRIRDINDGTFPQYIVEHQDDLYKDYILK